jgi:RNA polymerase sigma factor (sigma-70 family)
MLCRRFTWGECPRMTSDLSHLDAPAVEDCSDAGTVVPDVIPAQPSGDTPRPIRDPPPADVIRRRWDLVLPHRQELLRIARRRVACAADAEDAVATAMLRTVESRTLDEGRIAQFLCTTVIRLTVDVHRDRARQLAIGKRHVTREIPGPSAEDTLCDEAEARWLAAALSDCPERERQVLDARLGGLVGGDVATHLGLSAKAAENAYTRLRDRANKLVAATLAGLGFAGGCIRRAGPGLAVPVVLASVALTLGYSAPVQSAPQVLISTPATGVVESATAPASAQNFPEHSLRDSALDAGRRSAAVAAQVAAPAAERARVLTVEPPEPSRAVVGGGAVHIEEQKEYENETLVESAERCLARLDPQRPLADPCA